MAAKGRAYREQSDNVTVFEARARFVGLRELDVGAAETITADQIVIAAGSRPVIPELSGLTSVDFHTSDTVMRLAERPKSMIIIGGGYIAAEFAHVFAAFGTAVTVLNRSDVLLRREDADVAKRFTELLGRRVDVRVNTSVTLVESAADGRVRVHTEGPKGPPEHLDAEILLVATGRTPNGDTLDLDRGGIEADDDGLIIVDDYQRTSAAGVFALGDVSSRQQLKHAANKDARLVQHNLLHPNSDRVHTGSRGRADGHHRGRHVDWLRDHRFRRRHNRPRGNRGSGVPGDQGHSTRHDRHGTSCPSNQAAIPSD